MGTGEERGKLQRRLTGKSEFRVRFDGGDDATEHGRRHNVHLVQQDEPPFARRQKFHHLLRLVRPIVGIRHHGVRGHDDATFPGELETKRMEWVGVSIQRAEQNLDV